MELALVKGQPSLFIVTLRDIQPG